MKHYPLQKFDVYTFWGRRKCMFCTQLNIDNYEQLSWELFFFYETIHLVKAVWFTECEKIAANQMLFTSTLDTKHMSTSQHEISLAKQNRHTFWGRAYTFSRTEFWKLKYKSAFYKHFCENTSKEPSKMALEMTINANWRTLFTKETRSQKYF